MKALHGCKLDCRIWRFASTGIVTGIVTRIVSEIDELSIPQFLLFFAPSTATALGLPIGV
jgi:hypothetical protein